MSIACLVGVVVLNAFQMSSRNMPLLSDMLTLLACIFIWCGADCLLKYFRSWMVGISMFIFAVHFNIDMIVSKLLVKSLPDIPGFEGICFIMAWSITIGLSIFVAIMFKKYIPQLYTILNGGR